MLDAPEARPVAAMGLRLGGVAAMSVMTALVKLLDERGVHILEIMFYRQAFAALVVAVGVLCTTGIASLRTRRLGAHASRTIIGLFAMVTTFGGVALLPLAEATIIQFTVPMFATLLSVLLLKERPGIWRWSAMAVGFVGVLLVTGPSGEAFPLVGALVGLASAFFAALTSVLLRQLGATEHATTTVFWFSTLSLVPLSAALPFVARSHAPVEWLLLAATGTLGGIGQLGFTAALRLAPVSAVVPMDYSSLVWAIALGWLLFGALPGASTLLGAPLIVASGLLILFRESRLRRNPGFV